VSTRLVAPTVQVADGSAAEAVAALLRSEDCFWLDVDDPGVEDYALLRQTFGFHELAVEDSEQFDQRPKLEDYDGFAFLVVYGWSPDEDGLVEVHCFYAERYLVTVHRDPSPALDALVAKLERNKDPIPRGPLLLHEVIDRLVDGFFPVVQQLNEELDAIEERIFASPRHEQLEEIFRLKRRLVRLRRIVLPQRDVVGRLTTGGLDLPGMTREAERYFRDVYDHLVRLTEEIDGGRELTTSAIDAYLSTASNRLNATTKQLTVIATIFLPLSFLTGFFGQNFAWMVGEVSSWQAFAILGIGLEVLMVLGLVALFRLRGWF
jgi:magnesium transporter